MLQGFLTLFDACLCTLVLLLFLTTRYATHNLVAITNNKNLRRNEAICFFLYMEHQQYGDGCIITYPIRTQAHTATHTETTQSLYHKMVCHSSICVKRSCGCMPISHNAPPHPRHHHGPIAQCHIYVHHVLQHAGIPCVKQLRRCHTQVSITVGNIKHGCTPT